MTYAKYAKYTKIDPQSALQVLGPKQKKHGNRGQKNHKCPVCSEFTLSVGMHGFSCFSGKGCTDKVQQAFNLLAAGHDPEKFYQPKEAKQKEREKGEPRGFSGILASGHPEVKKLAARYGISEILAKLNFGYSNDSKALEDFLGYHVDAGIVGTFGAGLNSQNQVRVLGGEKPCWMSCKSDVTGDRQFFKPRLPGNLPEYKDLYKNAESDKAIAISITEGPGKTLSLVENSRMATFGAEGVSNVLSKPEFEGLCRDRIQLNIVFDADSEANWMVCRSELEAGKAALEFGTKGVVYWKWDWQKGKGFDDLAIFCRDNGLDWQNEITKYSYSEYIEVVRRRFPDKMAEWQEPNQQRYNPEPKRKTFRDPDEAPFVEPDPDEYLEYQKYLEFLEFSDDEDCKRKRELWIEQKIKSSRRRWKRSLQFSPDYLDTKSQYVDKRIFSPEWGSVAVRAPMGTGKTEALNSSVKNWQSRGKTGLLLGSRNSCLAQTCQRLGFPHLLFDGNANSLLEVEPGDFWGHCADTLPRWADASEWPDVVILDEISSLLPHASLGATCRQNRQHILKLFGEMLKEAETVYLLDANLKDWEVDFIEILAKKKFKRVEKPRDDNQHPLKIYNFIGSYSPEEPLEYPEILEHNSQKELNKYKPNNSHFWRESFLKEQSPTVVFSDSKKELKRLIYQKFGEDKLDFNTALSNGILRVDSETRNFPEVHAFQSDPVRFLLEFDIIALFCSPSVESGISMKFNRFNLKELGKILDDTRDYFGGFWLFNCHLSNEPITQMLLRVRDRNVPRYIFSRTYSPVPVLDSNSEFERNYLSALNTALTDYLDTSQFDNDFMASAGIEMDLEKIHNQVGEVIKQSFDGDLMSWHLLTQKIKAQQTYEKQNLRATLLERLAEDGADIVDVVGGIGGKRSLADVNKKIAYHRAGEIFDAPDTFVNVEGYEVEMTLAIAEEWSKGYLVSPEKRLIGEKWLIKNSLLPGIEATGLWSLDFLANFKFLNPDTYKQLYYRAINKDLTSFEKLKALKVSEVLTNGEGILATDIGRALPFVTSAIKTGLSSLWTQVKKKVYKGEEKELKDIAKKCSHKTNSWLFGKMGKQNLIKYLNTILSNFGYALKSTRRREGGERIREYQIEDLIETEIATECESLIISKYKRILEEKIARNLDFANNNPLTTGITTLEAVPRRINEIRFLDSRGTGTNAAPATDTAAKSENQEKSEVKAKSTPHNPETKTQFNDGDRLSAEPTPREELEAHEIATLLAHGIAI